MKAGWFIFVLAFVLSSATRADSVTKAEQDKAQKRIDACLRRNEVSSRECKHLKRNIQTLVEVYRQGDKTVLPTLLHFTYLTDFLAEALIADPDGFLSAVNLLSVKDRRDVTIGVGGSVNGVPRARFDELRTILKNVPESSPNYDLARKCLTNVEVLNADLFVSYFPPQAFPGAGEFKSHWFSQELYALKQQPLWPPQPENEGTFRVSVLVSYPFSSESVTLKILPDGSGQVVLVSSDISGTRAEAGAVHDISPAAVSDFVAAVERADLWNLPVEGEPPRSCYVLDGAQWILEAVQNGKYHVVVRLCPVGTSIGTLGQTLFSFANQKSHGECSSRCGVARAKK